MLRGTSSTPPRFCLLSALLQNLWVLCLTIQSIQLRVSLTESQEAKYLKTVSNAKSVTGASAALTSLGGQKESAQPPSAQVGAETPAAPTGCGPWPPRAFAHSCVSHRPLRQGAATFSRSPCGLSSCVVTCPTSACTCPLFSQENVSFHFCPHPLSSGLRPGPRSGFLPSSPSLRTHTTIIPKC